MKAISRAIFIKTALLPKDYPILKNASGRILPEIAVAGRSNVGKSSVLNNLFQVKHLVKTSSTPGKTQAINFFTFQQQAFVDLPGYGYASVPPAIRKAWGPMVRTYLQERSSLKLILFLLDIRRIPNEEDRQFVEWVVHHQKAMILVLTKVDKVNQKERQLNTEAILQALPAENLQYVYYSIPKNLGRKDLLRMIQEAMAEELSSENNVK